MKRLALVLLLTAACSNEKSNVPPQAAAAAVDTQNQDAERAAKLAKEKADADAAAAALAASRAMALDKFAYPIVHFSYDATEIDEEGRKNLQKVAEHLSQAQNVRILIAGHCDERGTSEYNLALGENRAKAVRKYLALLGVSPDRLDTVSFGKAQPLTQGQSENDFAQNRRAEFNVR